jgi:hypothetical protein
MTTVQKDLLAANLENHFRGSVLVSDGLPHDPNCPNQNSLWGMLNLVLLENDLHLENSLNYVKYKKIIISNSMNGLTWSLFNQILKSKDVSNINKLLSNGTHFNTIVESVSVVLALPEAIIDGFFLFELSIATEAKAIVPI